MEVPSTSTTPEQVQKIQTLLNGPAGKPPEGVIPSFPALSNLYEISITILLLGMVIATLLIFIRLYIKLYLIRSKAYEDYVVVLAWWVNITTILYGVVVFLIKLSILLQYLRIFVPNRKANMPLFVAIQTVIWSNFIFYFTDFIFQVTACTPREKFWNLLITTGHCRNTYAMYMASGIFNVLSDFAILILPIVPIWKLQLPFKRKILMIAIFSTGLWACVTSIMRTYYTWKVLKSPDVSYNVIIMGYWTIAEITTGIVVSCLPVMPKLFHHYTSKFYHSRKPNFRLQLVQKRELLDFEDGG
ncbi:hypothetical protein EPUS_04700 [Endocarpon pusillum Z07020]|uniref:Rhodopsin domain-containing protein n=1 Tax=Endocarpon pusillum (strain Z07020 / HMAS-L-300199) TaxID=1263415 RepID=U1FZP4_ENDPU|nr:uncharacterized protein EPUS_04700 [Endocarpon pusillum Z07020]ERF70422.1 hypothetical protein EPUS_04700 [Endocarpon pusillum Z07020]